MARLSTDTASSGSDETLARGLQKLILLAQWPNLTLSSFSRCSLASYLLEGDASGVEDLTAGFQALTSEGKAQHDRSSVVHSLVSAPTTDPRYDR